MIKKSLIKKLTVLGMALVMSLSMAACGDDDKKNTEKEINTEAAKDDTTESRSEEVTENDKTDTDEPVSTEAYVEENGKLTVKHVTIDLPDEFKFYDNMNGTIAYVTESGDKTFALYAEDDNVYAADPVVDAYVAQVKNVYGSQVTDVKKTYNGHEFTVMDIDDPDGKFYGRAAVFCEGSTVVYIEYVTATDDESQFDSMMRTITF